jgi:sugar phosphate isomerase/epimerase
MNMEKTLPSPSISMQIFLKYEVSEEMFRCIRNAGFEKCEIWAMGKHFNNQDKNTYMKVKDWSEKYGINPETAHLPLYSSESTKPVFLGQREIPKKFIDEILRCVEFLEGVIGVKTFIIHVGENPELFAERFEKVYINSDGRFAIENDPTGFPLAKDVLEIVLKLGKSLKEGEKRIGACLDIGHANIWEKPPENTIKILGEKIIATHISDNNGEKDMHILPGEGKINWENIKNAISDVGYKYNFTFELAPISDGTEPLEEYTEKVKPIISKAMKFYEKLFRE